MIMEYDDVAELRDPLEDESLLAVMSGDEGDTYLPHRDAYIDSDAYLQAVVDIQFDERFGAPYWRELMEEELEFDPREEIKSYDDLEKLPEADEDAIKERPVDDFMPRLFYDDDEGGTYDDLDIDPGMFDLSKSSGTTGKKKIMPWRTSVSDEIVQWYAHNLEERDTGDGNWLALGPYGLYEKHIEGMANEMGGKAYFSGIETRKLKKQAKHTGEFFENPLKGLRNGWSAFKGFLRMSRSQQVLREDLQSEPVSNIASAPALVERLYDDLDSDDAVSDPEDIETILLSGMGVTEEAVDGLEEQYENADVVPMYATSFCGPAFDTTDVDDLAYRSLEPFMTFEVLEDGDALDDREQVEYGDRGQVMFHRVAEDFFWPNQTERETALRVEGDQADYIASIVPDVD